MRTPQQYTTGLPYEVDPAPLAINQIQSGDDSSNGLLGNPVDGEAGRMTAANRKQGRDQLPRYQPYPAKKPFYAQQGPKATHRCVYCKTEKPADQFSKSSKSRRVDKRKCVSCAGLFINDRITCSQCGIEKDQMHFAQYQRTQMRSPKCRDCCDPINKELRARRLDEGQRRRKLNNDYESSDEEEPDSNDEEQSDSANNGGGKTSLSVYEQQPLSKEAREAIVAAELERRREREENDESEEE